METTAPETRSPATPGLGGWLKDRLTPTVMRGKLEAMAAMFNLRPSLRHHLRDTHPAGTSFTFDATIEFVTWDASAAVHVVFEHGKMRVYSGPADAADVTVRFKGREQMREFFAGSDTFDMLLENALSLEGNFSVILKFGHMSAVLAHGKKLVPPKRDSGWPARWQDLNDYPCGEPCAEAPAGEVTCLDEPHLAATTLSDLPRIKRLLWAYRTTEPAICSERPRLLTEYVLQSAGSQDCPALRQAKALHHIMANKQPIIRDGDLLAGTTTSKPIGVIIYPELGGTGIWPELLTMQARALNPYRIDDVDIDILNRQVFPFWIHDNIREHTRRTNGRPEVLELDERFVFYFMWKTQAASHTVIDVPRALGRGLRHIMLEAQEREALATGADKRAFYAALQIALDAVLVYANNLAAEATRLAEQTSDAARRAELLEMARVCQKVPAESAETLHEALQAIWILFIAQHMENMNAGMVVGRLDTWLEPYFQRDLEGASSEEKQRRIERALELCSALMLKLTDHLPMVPDVGNRLFGGSSENQVITLGGLTPEGQSAVCDMTWIFLKATEMLHLRDPNVNARFAPGVNSEAYLRRLCEVNALTHATPSLHNDDAVVPALEAQGFTRPDARDWTATGCVEPTSCGRHFGHTNCMMLNLVAPLEMALNDGVHPLLGRQVGPRTGWPTDFASYEEFFAAYKAQLGWVIDRSVEANNMLGRAHQQLKPTPLLSALFEGPMESGRDVINGGATYNTSGSAMIGLTDVVDSLAAIKLLVFERRDVEVGTLLEALAADFEGHDALLARVLAKVPKYGGDDALTNAIASDIVDFVCERFQAQEHYREGTYLPGYWSMSNHVAFGMLSGALPSGRRKGKPFTPGLTPTHLGKTALTEQIRTVAALDNIKTPNNIAFNVKVVPGGADTHAKVVDRMAAYAGTYFDLGGMQMQFNVVSTETLRAAMERPEEYGDLLVRISGYNAYFVQLNRNIQMELIERTEHALGT